MSRWKDQWKDLFSLDRCCSVDLMNLYSSDVLPMDVRQYLAPWIESQDWNRARHDTATACVLFQNLLEHLNNQYCRFLQDNEILAQHNIRMFKQMIQTDYQESPKDLAAIIADILNEEKKILDTARETDEDCTEEKYEVPMQTQRQHDIEQRILYVKNKVQTIDEDVKCLEEQQEMFDFRYKTYDILASSKQEATQKMQQNLQNMLNDLDRMRKDILAHLKELLGRCETLVHFLEEELGLWAERQQKACIGATVNVDLSLLETWMTGTVEAFFQLRRLLQELAGLPSQVSYENDPLRTDPAILQHRVNELLTCLLKRAFVVVEQPCMSIPQNRPLVLKTSTRFSVSTRLLLKLQEPLHLLNVTVSMDKNPPNTKGYRRFNILGTQTKGLYGDHVQKKGLVADFKYLTLKEQRAGVGGKGSKGINDVPVTEELHLMHFNMQFKYQELELDIEITTLPLIIISNMSQLSCGWASVFWFNLLSKDTKNLAFFYNAPAALWTDLAHALSWQFSSATERELDADQLLMLAEKLCGQSLKSDSQVKWAKFSKDNLPRQGFPFWTWFDGLLDLVVKHLLNIWNDGSVIGFISRAKERSLLKRKVTGTFLLRFSESCKDGAVTVSWVEHQENGSPIVRSVEPYTKKDLENLPLPDILHNYQIIVDENIPENTLLYLYPDIPKDEAFGKYYSQHSNVNLEEYRRYMQRKLIMVSERRPDMMENSRSDEQAAFDNESIEMHLSLPNMEQLDLLTRPANPMISGMNCDSDE